MAKKIFRETALERLSSPEQLDRMIRVTSPRGWMSLTALLAVVGVVIAWSFLGRIPTTEMGKGILIPAGGSQQVVAPSTGRLTKLNVKKDDPVNVGDVVAVIDKPELDAQLQLARLTLENLKERKKSLDQSDDALAKLDEEVTAAERKEIDTSITTLHEKVARRRDYQKSVEELVAAGMMTDIDVMRVKEEIEGLEASIEAARNQLGKLDAKKTAADAQRARDRLNRQLELEKASNDVNFLQNRIGVDSQVISKTAGHVVEIRAAVNSSVNVGDTIVLLQSGEEAGGDLTAVLYVKAGSGPNIKADDKNPMEVFILPSTVKREEYGTIEGRVIDVAKGPTSRSAMLATLKDPSLVEQFVRDVGLPFEVKVSLKADTATPSGYKWTSGRGAPVKISEGTLCTGWITIKKQRPVNLVVPLFGDEN